MRVQGLILIFLSVLNAEKRDMLVNPAADNDSSIIPSIYSILSISSCDSEDSEEDFYYNGSYCVI